MDIPKRTLECLVIRCRNLNSQASHDGVLLNNRLVSEFSIACVTVCQASGFTAAQSSNEPHTCASLGEDFDDVKAGATSSVMQELRRHI
jgi:hypothetical protein